MSQPIQPSPPTLSPQGKKLLDQYRDALRIKHYFYRTEQAADLGLIKQNRLKQKPPASQKAAGGFVVRKDVRNL